MKHIENQIYYHIQRLELHKKSFWKPGITEFIGDSKNPFAHYYDIAGFHEINEENIVDVFVHYQRFARETVFEEVRLKYFPNLPSRLNCLWVIPENDEAIEYWKSELCQGKECRLVKLSLTGIIHKANQAYLELNNRPMNYNRQQAFKYWNGSSGNGSQEDEYLFQGFVEVLESNEI